MASCTKCGATLAGRARFCASCGSPVTSASVVPPPDPSAGDARPDPFAKTMLKSEAEPALANLPPPVSPMAASIMATPPPNSMPSVPPQRPSTEYAPPLPMAVGQPAMPAAQPAMPGTRPPVPAAQPPAPMHPFAPGALVLVYWADGNRYPGTVLQVAPHHVFVVFPNGTQQWVDARYVTTS